MPKTSTLGSSARSRTELKLTDMGLPGLGYIMGGGFPTSSVYLLTGQTGSYYQAFAQQALYNMAKAETKVAYYTIESTSEDVLQDMATFKWDVNEYLDNGSWVFTRLIPPTLKTIAGKTPEDPREQTLDLPPNSLTSLTEDFSERLKEGRWTALNIAYLLNCYPEQEITDLVMYWVNAAHTFGGIHFILMPEGTHSESHLNYLKSIVDGVLSFRFAQGFEQAEGEIEIQKLRRVIPKVKTVRHAIQDDGLVIETSARVG
ncbi:MAG: RAD55 family ATPase [Thaumarchaeota archaeon]|nr:RAD55 family ATPase [Nitrososphaerota archaeon]